MVEDEFINGGIENKLLFSPKPKETVFPKDLLYETKDQ